ncbi:MULTISPECIES: hypothetical protein [Streptomyces]|nr:hypothetical protein [Streptomyces sp. JHD 1]MCX2971016.1 hypothetical protein [Streptomyces sp. JHD 1]
MQEVPAFRELLASCAAAEAVSRPPEPEEPAGRHPECEPREEADAA